MQFTQREVRDREDELKDIDIQLESILNDQRVAREFGDASENAELEIATKQAAEKRKRKEELTSELSDYDLIVPDNGPRFTLGSTVTITQTNVDGKPIGTPRTFLIANSGDTITEGILGIKSPLGSAILNGTEGVYTVQTENGGVYYHVKKEILLDED